MMLPQGFGVLREVFPEDERQKAFALFGPVIGLSAVFGPLIGGALIDWNLFGSGWRLVFLVNVPIGVAAVLAACDFCRPHRAIAPCASTSSARSWWPCSRCCSSTP